MARSTWPDEAAKWSHLQGFTVAPIVGTVAQRKAALRQGANVYTMNYEQLPWLVKLLGDKWPFTKIVADESTRLKSFRTRQGSQRAQALARVAHRHASRFIELTGTPSPNGLQDLWGQAWFLDKGQRLGTSFSAFERRWFQAIPVGNVPAARELRPCPTRKARSSSAWPTWPSRSTRPTGSTCASPSSTWCAWRCRPRPASSTRTCSARCSPPSASTRWKR